MYHHKRCPECGALHPIYYADCVKCGAKLEDEHA